MMNIKDKRFIIHRSHVYSLKDNNEHINSIMLTVVPTNLMTHGAGTIMLVDTINEYHAGDPINIKFKDYDNDVVYLNQYRISSVDYKLIDHVTPYELSMFWQESLESIEQLSQRINMYEPYASTRILVLGVSLT